MISEETGLPVPPEGMYWEVKLVGFWNTPRIYLRDSNDRVVEHGRVYWLRRGTYKVGAGPVFELTDKAVYESACRVLDWYNKNQKAKKLVGKYPPNKVEL